MPPLPFGACPNMVAILGCAIEPSPLSMWSVFVQAYARHLGEMRSVQSRADRPWSLKLLELTAQLVDYDGALSGGNASGVQTRLRVDGSVVDQ